MKAGDKVKHVDNAVSIGIVRAVNGKKVAVTWRMGSGWNWTVMYRMDELVKVEEAVHV